MVAGVAPCLTPSPPVQRGCNGPQIAALGAGMDIIDSRGGSLHALSGKETGTDLSALLWLVDKVSSALAVLGASRNGERR